MSAGGPDENGATKVTERVPHEREPVVEPTPKMRAPGTARRVVQRRIVVGAADDPLEHEADRIADRVQAVLANQPATARSVQRTTRIVRRTGTSARPEMGAEGGVVDGELGPRIVAVSGGRPLEPGVRTAMEGALGANLGGVRIHANSHLPQRVSAEAFTLGNRIHFAPGRYDPGSEGGQHLLSHEIAHVVRQGAAPVVRRKLIPKALDAFNAAEAANPDFGTGRKDTDDLAAENDQEDLARVHGRNYRGGDSDDQKRVAHYVRAVVLSEYSARLRALETATNSDGSPLSGGQRSAKKAVYKKKAEEFRQKHVPLVAKSSRSPETQTFLKEFGFDVGFAPPKPNERKGAARIDVRATFIGGAILGMRMRAHLFIVYTAEDGGQLYFRGGPDSNGYTVSELGDYAPGTVDWDPSAPSVTLLEGPAAKDKLDALVEATRVINGMKVPYQAVIAKEYGGHNPNAVQDLANAVSMGRAKEGENCNATAWTILTRAGIPTEKPAGHHPGWGSILGSQTAGKENALPAAETDKPGMAYTVDDTRDVATTGGLVQMYADRLLVEPTSKIGVGTKVSLLDEKTRYRKIRYAGVVGYIPVRREDRVYMLAPKWMKALDRYYTIATIKNIATRLDDQSVLDDVEDDTGIPADHVPAVVRMITADGGARNGMIEYRLNQLGPARLRDMLKGDEIARLAAMLGANANDVLAAATAIVGERERVAKVPVALLKHLNDPNAANLAINEAPDFKTLKAIATELGETVPWVTQEVGKLRPKANQSNTLQDLLAASPVVDRALPNVADSILSTWASVTGVPVAYLKARCAEIHKEREAKKAEAARKAKEEKETAERKKAEERAARRQAKEAKAEAAAKLRCGLPAAPPLPAVVHNAVVDDFRKLSTDDQEIWRILNMTPELTEVRRIAQKNGASTAQAALAALAAFPRHKGRLLLDVALKLKVPPEQRRVLADGTMKPEHQDLILRGLEADTGLDPVFLRERIVAFVAATKT